MSTPTFGVFGRTNLEHPHTSPECSNYSSTNIYIIYLQAMSDIPSCELSLVTAAAVHLLWAYGVVVSMFDFHRSDRGSIPIRGGKISKCLRLHYSAAPLASV